MQHWYDRKDYKTNIDEWFEQNDKFLVYSISDPREITDIFQWMRNKTQYLKWGEAVLDKNLDNQKNKLLRQLMDNLGGRDTFSNYYHYIDAKIENSLSIQQIGVNKSKSKQDINVDNLFQIIELNESCFNYETLIEGHMVNLLDLFFIDVKNIECEQLLFLIRFGQNGFDDLSLDFKEWFLRDFCGKLVSFKVKICILTTGRIDTFNDFVNYEYRREISEYLYVDEIMEEMKEITGKSDDYCKAFCISEYGNKIPYSSFQKKFTVHHS